MNLKQGTQAPETKTTTPRPIPCSALPPHARRMVEPIASGLMHLDFLTGIVVGARPLSRVRARALGPPPPSPRARRIFSILIRHQCALCAVHEPSYRIVGDTVSALGCRAFNLDACHTEHAVSVLQDISLFPHENACTYFRHAPYPITQTQTTGQNSSPFNPCPRSDKYVLAKALFG